MEETAPGNRPTASEPVSPQRISQMAWGFTPPLILQAAVENRIFDVLDKGPKTLDEVADATGASRRGVRMLLNSLVGLQLLNRQGDRYAMAADVEAFLVRGKPGFLGGVLSHLTGQLLSNWVQLPGSVRTGKPAVPVNREGPGSDFFTQFVESLFSMNYAGAAALGDEVARLYAGNGAIEVLDIAAGSGVWGIAIARKMARARIAAVDWPAVCAVTRKVAQQHDVGDRLHTLEGDINEIHLGTGYQVATLGHILHSEGESRSRKLLRRVYDALASGGTIAIAEFTPDDGRSGPAFPLIFAVNMLIHTDDGDTFTFPELKNWLQETGFRDVRQLQVPAPSPLVLATKP